MKIQQITDMENSTNEELEIVISNLQEKSQNKSDNVNNSFFAFYFIIITLFILLANFTILNTIPINLLNVLTLPLIFALIASTFIVSYNLNIRNSIQDELFKISFFLTERSIRNMR